MTDTTLTPHAPTQVGVCCMKGCDQPALYVVEFRAPENASHHWFRQACAMHATELACVCGLGHV